MKKLFSLLSLAILSTACGENFEGDFVTDQAEIVDNDCNNATGSYEMDLAVTLSGNDVQFTITRLQGVNTKSSDIQALRWIGITYTASMTGDDRLFNADFRGFENLNDAADRGYTAQGRLNTSRDQMTNFVLTLDTYDADPERFEDARECSITFTAQSLELVK